VSAYGFTENYQFAAKTDQNYIFLCRGPHILDWLYLMVPHMIFYEFSKKNQIFAQNLYVLAYGFTENRQFMTKTDRNSVYVGRHPLFWIGYT
jgi:hypothetical protein